MSSLQGVYPAGVDPKEQREIDGLIFLLRHNVSATDEYQNCEPLQKFLNDDKIARIVYGNKKDIKASTDQILKLAKIFVKYRPDLIEAKDVEDAHKQGNIRVVCMDGKQRPIVGVWKKYGDWSNLDNGKYFKLTQWLLYRVNKLLNKPGSPGQIAVFIDLDTFSLSDTPSSDLVKEIATYVSMMHPELLGCAMIINSPVYFKGLWALISPFLSEKSREKYKFVNGDFGYGSSNAKALEQAYGPVWRNLIVFGQPQFTPGATPGYDHDSEWKAILAEEAKEKDAEKAGEKKDEEKKE